MNEPSRQGVSQARPLLAQGLGPVCTIPGGVWAWTWPLPNPDHWVWRVWNDAAATSLAVSYPIAGAARGLTAGTDYGWWTIQGADFYGDWVTERSNIIKGAIPPG